MYEPDESEYETVMERASEDDATIIPKRIAVPTRSKDPSRSILFNARFQQGRANVEEHMRRMTSTRDLAGCPCLSCSGRFR